MERIITEEMLSDLRENIAKVLSERRCRHTLEVEKMAARLGEIYCFADVLKLRAAALLHDLTKELDTEAQIALCEHFDLSVSEADRLSPKTFHAKTAAALIGEEYPAYAAPTVVEAVRWHTTGRVGMTLTEQLLYLADYIDMSRTFHSCVVLRRYFWGAHPEEMDAEQRLTLLRETLAFSFDLTMRDLLDDGALIAKETVEARNELKVLLAK